VSKSDETVYARQCWQTFLRDRLLRALKAYTKIEIARSLGEEDNWSEAIENILTIVPDFMNDKEVKTKKFNRKKALEEVFYEASIGQNVVLEAKNEYEEHNPRKLREIIALEFDSEDLMKKMIETFLPQYEEFLPKGEKSGQTADKKMKN